MKTFKEFNEKSKGLYYNIHKRRKSGKRMRKKGEKGAPKPGDFKRAAGESVDESIINIRNEIETIKQRLQKASKDKQRKEVARLKKTLKSLQIKKQKLLRADVNEKAPNTSDAMKRYKSGKAGFTDIAHLKAKGLIKRSDGTKRKSKKYEKLDPKKHDAGDYVKDFQKSDAPQIKGKSKAKRQKMAIAAYLDAKDKMDEGKGKKKKKPESFEKQFDRRVVKTTKPEHKAKGYNWRIKGKDRPEVTIKLYKKKPGYQEFVKQLKRVAGHEFGG